MARNFVDKNGRKYLMVDTEWGTMWGSLPRELKSFDKSEPLFKAGYSVATRADGTTFFFAPMDSDGNTAESIMAELADLGIHPVDI